MVLGLSEGFGSVDEQPEPAAAAAAILGQYIAAAEP